MTNKVDFGNTAREKLVAGVNIIADAIRVTIGAKGKNVIIEDTRGGTIITNDGVTVARAINLKDNMENMGAGLIREACSETERIAGDGTSTAAILTQAMIKIGMKYLSAESNPMDLKRGMEKAGKLLAELISKHSIPVKFDSVEVGQIATISANNDKEMGAIIEGTIKRIGVDGVISVQNSNTAETTVAIVEGAEFDRGWISPYFTNNSTNDKAELKDPYVLVTDHKLFSFKDILPILDKIRNERPLLIVSDEIDETVLQTIILNQSQGIINVLCIKAPELGDARIDALRDIATITGATFISAGMKMKLGEDVTMDMLGSCDVVTSTSDKTTIVGGDGEDDKINGLIDQVKSLLKTEEDSYTKSKLEKRLAKLVGGVAVIYVGAPTETELEEKKFRLDDALSATRSAIAEGIVPGGGVALLNCIAELDNIETENDDERLGVKIVQTAIKEPFNQIMLNADEVPQEIYKELMKRTPTEGYNVQTGEYVDMIKAGIIDPARVTKSAVQHSISIASMLLTTEAVISNNKED